METFLYFVRILVKTTTQCYISAPITMDNHIGYKQSIDFIVKLYTQKLLTLDV